MRFAHVPSVLIPPNWVCRPLEVPPKLSRAYLAGSDDHDAADAGGVAAGFDFGDAARMAAEFAPILGGAPAGQRRH